MLGSIKNYALAALAVLTGILAALWQYQKAKFKSAKLKGERQARKQERKATDALVKGLDNENKIQNDNTVDRSKFLDN